MVQKERTSVDPRVHWSVLGACQGHLPLTDPNKIRDRQQMPPARYQIASGGPDCCGRADPTGEGEGLGSKRNHIYFTKWPASHAKSLTIFYAGSDVALEVDLESARQAGIVFHETGGESLVSRFPIPIAHIIHNLYLKDKQDIF